MMEGLLAPFTLETWKIGIQMKPEEGDGHVLSHLVLRKQDGDLERSIVHGTDAATI